MIRFLCSTCSRLISVDDKYSGKKGKCPKCSGVVVVPERTTVIEFACQSCGHKIRVPEKHAGRKGACPKCKDPIEVPSLKKPPSESAGTFSVTCPMCEELIEVPEASRGQTVECPACGSYVETSPGGDVADSGPSISPGVDEDSYTEKTEEEYEESEGLDRRLIVIISAVAGAVIVGLVLLVTVLKLARPQDKRAETGEALTQLELGEAQDLAERYIGLLENGQLDEAIELHSPGFGERKPAIEGYARQIGIMRITKLDCRRTRCERYPEGDQIFLWYSLEYERGRQSIILSMIRIGQELTVDGIAVWRVSGHSVSAGPKTRDALSAAAAAATEQSRSFLKKFAGVILIVGLVVVLIQVVSMWIVFEKDGRPGWASIIPFYNMWVLAEIGGQHGGVGLAMCFTGIIPYIGNLIGLALWLVISLGVAKTFGRGVLFGLGLSFLPSIFYPILAFSKG